MTKCNSNSLFSVELPPNLRFKIIDGNYIVCPQFKMITVSGFQLLCVQN